VAADAGDVAVSVGDGAAAVAGAFAGLFTVAVL
jgi:hypothetical protein